MTHFYILDERNVWHQAIAVAARNNGFEPIRIARGRQVEGPGWGFIRPHATPAILERNCTDYHEMAKHVQMVQDWTQVGHYEDKVRQADTFKKWLPDTWLFEDRQEAFSFARNRAQYPIVSKAAEGASSVNVRILPDSRALLTHLDRLWSRGVVVQHCDSKGTKSLQEDYALLQEFIPHNVTYRVNVIGNGRAVFKRYNYPDRQVAQTGNVEPMWTEDTELLEFADRIASDIETKWCALDILKRPDGQHVLLETSLAWPWPSPGVCMDAPIFRTPYKWSELFECMFNEIVCI